jgi:hypothetical protein
MENKPADENEKIAPIYILKAEVKPEKKDTGKHK